MFSQFQGGQGGFCKHAQVRPAPEAAGPPLTRGNDRRGAAAVGGACVVKVQFYRHKPIGHYIVDFHAPAVALVVEVDGAHHLEASQAGEDEMRTAYLEKQGLRVLRFRGCNRI